MLCSGFTRSLTFGVSFLSFVFRAVIDTSVINAAELQPANNDRGRVVRYKFAFQWYESQVGLLGLINTNPLKMLFLGPTMVVANIRRPSYHG